MHFSQQAVSLFNDGYNCSQAVLAAFAPELGLDKETAVKLATGFGVGLSHGDTCGALSGAIMVLGLKYGGGGPDGLDAKTSTYALAQELAEEYGERMGSTVCRKIIGCDPSTPEGYKQAVAENKFGTTCCGAIATAAELLDNFL